MHYRNKTASSVEDFHLNKYISKVAVRLVHTLVGTFGTVEIRLGEVLFLAKCISLTAVE